MLDLQKLFYKPGAGFEGSVIYIKADEVSIATKLNNTVAQFPSVSFGSYPKLYHRLV